MARRYSSPVRKQQSLETRQQIQKVAIRLFGSQGYNATTVRQLADEAGVSLATLYSLGGKPALLLAAFKAVLLAEPDGNPMVGAPDSNRLLMVTSGGDALREVASASEFILGMTKLITESRQRASGLWAALVEGANSDAFLAEAYRAYQTSTRQQVLSVVEWMVDRGLIRPPADPVRAADLCWATSHPAQFALLVGAAGWTPEEYRDWLVSTHLALLT